MNKEITLLDVRNEAMEAIQQLKSGKMDIKTASEIRNLLGVVIDTAKTQVEYLKAIPNSVKEKMSEQGLQTVAATFNEPKKLESIDDTLKEIEERRKQPYVKSKTIDEVLANAHK